MEKTEQVVQDRSQTYGDFMQFSELVQHLERSCIAHMQQHNPTAMQKMHPVMVEGLHMILHKVARIVNGDPAHEDSWRDISGYAKLVADRVPLIFGGNSLGHNHADPATEAPVPNETTLATGDMDDPVGGVHPHEEEPRHDHVDSSETSARRDFAQRY